MTDPWMVRECTNSGENNLESTIDSRHLENNIKFEFEDDFSPQSVVGTGLELPDSKQYLESLERKLYRLKRDPNILRQLSEKREECIRNLLNDSLNIDRDGDLALDAPVTLGDSTVHEIYRHIRPIQPINIGETVHIVKHDQLEEQRVLDEVSEDSSEPASR